MTVFDANDAVCHLSNGFIVGYHYNSLDELLSRYFKEAQYVLRGLAVKVACWLVCKDNDKCEKMSR